MAEFRFRAAAALELRRQQEQTAAQALAKAEAEFREAQAVLASAVAERRTAQTTQLEQSRHGTTVETLLWHRNWISRLGTSVDRLRAALEVRAATVRDAERLWHLARRRRLALERMRDRARRRFQLEQDRQELKTIDELARLRHAMPEPGHWRDES